MLGAGAVFLILGIAGVSLRANCFEAGVCVDAVDTVTTGSIAATPEVEAQPAFAAPAAPESREMRLKSAGGLIAATFDTLLIEPDASVGAEQGSAEPIAVAAVQNGASGPDNVPPTLTKRVVQSVEVTAEGQPVWASPASAAVAVVAEAPANQAVAVARQVASTEPVAEIEPLAFNASAAAAPIPKTRSVIAAPAVAEVATTAPEPEVVTEVATAEPEPEPKAAGDKRIVTGQGVNVRSGPSSSRGKLFALQGGAEVTVSSKERGWFKVTDDRGRTGWVYSNYLRPAG